MIMCTLISIKVNKKGMINLDSSGWILVFIILGVIGVIVYFWNTNKGDEYTPPAPPVPSPKPPEPTPAPKPPEPNPVPKPPVPEKLKYVTIYEYTSVQTVRKCSYCDGENKSGTRVCCICGKEIDT